MSQKRGQPNIDFDDLMLYLKFSGIQLALDGIQDKHAYFKSYILYQIDNNIRGKYQVIARIPLNNTLFKNKYVEYISAEISLSEYFKFYFEYYTDNKGHKIDI